MYLRGTRLFDPLPEEHVQGFSGVSFEDSLQILPGGTFKQKVLVKFPQCGPEYSVTRFLPQHVKNHGGFVITHGLGGRVGSGLKSAEGKIG